MSCLAALIAWTVTASASVAATCQVPGGYSTIGAALAAPGCETIVVAAGSYPENLSIARDVTVTGAGSNVTTLTGWIGVSGPTTDVTVNALRVDAGGASSDLCSASGLQAHHGARVTGADLVVVGRPGDVAGCSLFRDGFESGTTGAW